MIHVMLILKHIQFELRNISNKRRVPRQISFLLVSVHIHTHTYNLSVRVFIMSTGNFPLSSQTNKELFQGK